MKRSVNYEFEKSALKVVFTRFKYDDEDLRFYEMSVHLDGQPSGDITQFKNLEEMEDCANAMLSYIELRREYLDSRTAEEPANPYNDK